METEQQEASTPVPAAGAGEGDLDYEQLLELYDQSMRHLVEGELVSGRVIEITPNDVVVDVGYKSEGLVPRQEFTDHGGELMVDIGDEVEVLLEKTEGRRRARAPLEESRRPNEGMGRDRERVRGKRDSSPAG